MPLRFYIAGENTDYAIVECVFKCSIVLALVQIKPFLHQTIFEESFV